MTTRVAINGFGRIGRAAFKIALNKRDLTVVGINDLTDTATLAHLLQYDTVYGKYEKKVTSDAGAVIVDGKAFPVTAQKDPATLPWKTMNVDVVIESTGRFLTQDLASGHLKAGAKRVVLSAPPKGADIGTVVLGVNGDIITNAPEELTVISNASCTTNCIAPVAQVMHAAFGVKKAMMTTIHSYTADQNLVDGPHKDLRRARAAAQNIVPTSTGAAISTTETVPELKGLFDGLAIRVPTIVGSLADFTFLLSRTVTKDEVNEALIAAAESPRYKGILEATSAPLVSSDIIGDPHSSIADLTLTKVVDGDLVKVIAWYDNEWGYSNRLVELVQHIGKTL